MLQESRTISEEHALSAPLITSGDQDLVDYMTTIQPHLVVAARSALHIHQPPDHNTQPLLFARSHILYLELLRHPYPLNIPHDNYRLLSAHAITYDTARTRCTHLFQLTGSDNLAITLLDKAEAYNSAQINEDQVCIYVMPVVRTLLVEPGRPMKEHLRVSSKVPRTFTATGHC